MKRIMSKQSGLTLTEMLAVVSILVVVLGAITLFSWGFLKSYYKNSNSYASKNPVRFLQETIEKNMLSANCVVFDQITLSSGDPAYTLEIDTNTGGYTTFIYTPNDGKVYLANEQVLDGAEVKNYREFALLDPSKGFSYQCFDQNGNALDTASLPLQVAPDDPQAPLLVVTLTRTTSDHGQNSSFSSTFTVKPIRQVT
jgi:prepilin-type N-terminal cleavage/methylation domain-containing protein